jgi:hypothetical protein
MNIPGKFTVDLVFSPHAGIQKIALTPAACIKPAAPSPALARKVEEFSPFYAWEEPPAGLRAFGSLRRAE